MGLFRRLAVSMMSDDRLRVDKLTAKAVPEFLKFNMERNLPICDMPLHRGYFIFPSVQSFEAFKRTRGAEIGTLDANAMGVPLLRIERQFLTHGMTMISSEVKYKVYRYEVRTINDPPPYGGVDRDCTVIAENGQFKVYKYLFADIYKADKASESALKIAFIGGDNSDLHGDDNALYMLHRRAFRDMDTSIKGVNLRWHVRYSPLQNDHYKLALLNPREPSLLDSAQTRASKRKANITKIEPYTAVLGHYTSEAEDLLPGFIVKDADFIIGENGSPANIGIANIPELTVLFATQALVLHCIERERDENSRRNSNALMMSR
ncbi:Dia1 protein [Maudiozyma humilis]|uniref:Dia1 protein n=1 Tax=Maudiozyma humilis TaxID=51915 RepID=A0AAV5S3J3_MAUHU|nr:Dia1 protein [Kazachstania humilis]